MFGEKKGTESKLNRIHVSCKTCGISEAFYSNLSVANFKLKHAGHDIDDGSQRATPPEGREAKPVPAAQKAQGARRGTKLFKVVVDLMDFPAFPNPVFRVRGIKDDLSTAFILTSPFEESARVKETLASCQYVDYGYSEMLYTWEPGAVEYEGQARERLGLPGEAARRFRSPDSVAPKVGPSRDAEPTTVAKTNEILFDVRKAAERGPTNGEEQRVAPPVLPVTQDPFERRVPPSVRRPLQERAPAPERTEAPPSRAQIPVRTERPFEERTPAPEQPGPPAPRAPTPVRPERKAVEEMPDRVLAPMPDLNEAPAPREQIPVQPERKAEEEIPDRVLTSLPDLIDVPARRVEVPARPSRTPVKETPEHVLSSVPELIEAPARRVEAPVRTERPFQERKPAPAQYEAPAPPSPVPVRPERKVVEEISIKAPTPVPVKVEPQPHPMQFPVRQEQKPPDSRPKEAPAAASTNKPDDTLLVSKSWYIQGGTANRDEAVRISRVLKDFRWKVEPMYTIGVMLDDILSIESAKNQINRKVIKAVEDAGYRLTAVTADQGKVVAWFKKKEASAK